MHKHTFDGSISELWIQLLPSSSLFEVGPSRLLGKASVLLWRWRLIMFLYAAKLVESWLTQWRELVKLHKEDLILSKSTQLIAGKTSILLLAFLRKRTMAIVRVRTSFRSYILDYLDCCTWCSLCILMNIVASSLLDHSTAGLWGIIIFCTSHQRLIYSLEFSQMPVLFIMSNHERIHVHHGVCLCVCVMQLQFQCLHKWLTCQLALLSSSSILKCVLPLNTSKTCNDRLHCTATLFLLSDLTCEYSNFYTRDHIMYVMKLSRIDLQATQTQASHESFLGQNLVQNYREWLCREHTGYHN